MTIQAILFDLDNTLIDRRKSIIKFSNRFYNEIRQDLINCDLTKLENTLIALDNQGYEKRDQFFINFIEMMEWSKKPRFIKLLNFWFVQFPDCVLPEDNLFDTLAFLKQKYRLGIISNSKEAAIQQKKITTLGIAPLMDLIIISNDYGVEKPDPRIFQIALSKLKITAAEAVFVGDSPLADIVGAGNAGLKPIWKQNQDARWPDDLRKPDDSIMQISELINML
jgi:putative hydrolase of the HAD superfamily